MESRLCIEASAGSGKTYNLAKRYLQLLSLIFSKSGNLNTISPKHIGSIVAITFTNMAAAEMKERILRFLKELSNVYKNSGINAHDFDFLTKENAQTLLFDILKNQKDFNVTTIDSFMNKILRAFSSDLEISPDYEISFDKDELTDMAIDELISDSNLMDELIEFIKVRIELGDSGINGKKILKSALSSANDEYLIKNVTDYKQLCGIFKVNSYNELLDEIKFVKDSLYQFLSKSSNDFNKNKVGFILKDTDNFIEKIIEKKYIAADLLKKNQKIDSSTLSNIDELLKKGYELSLQYTLLKNVAEAESVYKVFKDYKVKESEVKEFLNVLDGSKISKMIGEILNEENGVTYAFCKLGERINHYLIDEFQDTSREQFDAIYPLIENALGENGSLFVVGDKKQAIYAWRGGDYEIFDKLLEKVEDIFTQELKSNFRSYLNIVKFNNEMFSNMFDESIFELYEEDFRTVIESEISKVYKNVIQKAEKPEGGYIKVALLNEEEGDLIDEFYKKELINTLAELIDCKISPSQIMILLRKKEDIEKVITWLSQEYPDLHFITEDSLNVIKNIEIKKLLAVANALLFKDDENHKKALSELNISTDDFDKLYENMHRLSPYEFFLEIIRVKELDYKNNELYFNAFLEELLKLNNRQYGIFEILNYFYEKENCFVTLPENIDAIKVMTIHKAKGLESHTVIIPFYDWEIYDSKRLNDLYGFFEVDGISQPIYARAKKDLRSVLDSARKFYNQKLKINFIEAVNLMYVANTRAVLNLIIIGAYKLNKDGKFPKEIKASHLIKNALKDKLETVDNVSLYTVGVLKAEKEENRFSAKGLSVPELNLNIRNYLKIYPETYELVSTFDKKYTGDLYHLAISFIKTLNSEDEIDKAVTSSYKKACGILNYENELVATYLKETILHLKDYFINVQFCKNEKEFTDSKGNIYRIDKIVKTDENFVIIDFKTGSFNEKHILQMKNYLKLLENSKGIIYYAETGKCVHVS